MKTLVAFYSRTGTTRHAGKEIARHLKADIEEITAKKDRCGIIGYIMSGKEATLKRPAEINPPYTNPGEYDLVVIGTPIWGWNISSPIRSYLANSFNQVAFFCTQGGSGGMRAFAEMEKLSKKPLAALELTTKEVRSEEYSHKVEEFVNSIKKIT
ncbi:MAG: hypothetical protein ABH879_02350 [archaeon]